MTDSGISHGPPTRGAVSDRLGGDLATAASLLGLAGDFPHLTQPALIIVSAEFFQEGPGAMLVGGRPPLADHTPVECGSYENSNSMYRPALKSVSNATDVGAKDGLQRGYHVRLPFTHTRFCGMANGYHCRCCRQVGLRLIRWADYRRRARSL